MPSFETFKIEPTDSGRFRIRITNEPGEESPIFRGLYLLSETVVEENEPINQNIAENISGEIPAAPEVTLINNTENEETNPSDNEIVEEHNNNGQGSNNENTTVYYGNGPVWNDHDFILNNPNVTIIQTGIGNSNPLVSAIVESVRNSPRGEKLLDKPKLTGKPALLEDVDSNEHHESVSNEGHENNGNSNEYHELEEDDYHHGPGNGNHNIPYDNYFSGNDDHDFIATMPIHDGLPHANIPEEYHGNSGGNNFVPMIPAGIPGPATPVAVLPPMAPGNNSGGNNFVPVPQVIPAVPPQSIMPVNNSGNNNSNHSNNGNNNFVATIPSLIPQPFFPGNNFPGFKGNKK